MKPETIRRENWCKECGRVFTLEYDPQTGRAYQSWQTGCKTHNACMKKYMTPSNFISDEALKAKQN